MPERSVEEITALAHELGRHGLGGINPSAEQIHDLISANLVGPLQFLNLLCYHDRARYPDDHELAGSGLSGSEAYARYGMIALEHVTRRGGRLALYNDVVQSVIGDGEPWHQIAIMEYPESDSFLDMISDPDYVRGLVHRDAGLAKTVVMVTRSLLPPSAS
jgi:uncharacterized protein (DUF1330 family)